MGKSMKGIERMDTFNTSDIINKYDTTNYNFGLGAEFLTRLNHTSQTLVAQGPTGTLLMAETSGENIPAAFWNMAEPSTIEYIHRLYCAAGAEVLITNTFQANRRSLDEDDIFASVDSVCDYAVRSALLPEASYILGSVGPVANLEVGYRDDSEEYALAHALYCEQVHALLNAGAHGILLETFSSINQLAPALRAANDVAAGMPVLVSFAINEEGNLLADVMNIEGAIIWAEKHGAHSVGINCCSVETAEAVVPRMLAAARTPVTVRPSAGVPERTGDGNLEWANIDDEMSRLAPLWRDAGVSMIGSCCGTNQATTCSIVDALQ